MASKSESNAPALRESAGFGIGAICLAASLLVHTVLAPLPSFSALLKRHPPAAAKIERAALSEIPVDVISDPTDQSAPAPAENVEPPVPSRDVSANHEGFQNLEKPPPQRPQRASGQPSPSTRAQAAGPRLDVSARASSNSSHVLGHSLVKDCSLSALVDMTQVRAHPLAPQLGALLVQWQSLFGEPGLDPMRDVDRLLVIGPELRASGRGLVVVQHHRGGSQMRATLDRLLARGTAVGDPAQEHYYVQISPDLLLVAPDRESSQPRDGFVLAPPPEGTIGTLYVDTPSRALRDLPIELPPSIHWLRGIIQLMADNGIAVDIEAGDESAELAKRNARQLTRSVLSLKTKGHGRFIERALFEAQDSVIVGRLEMTTVQIGALFDVLSDRVKARPAPPPSPEEPTASEGDDSQPEQPAATGDAPQAVPSDAGVSQTAASAIADGGDLGAR